MRLFILFISFLLLSSCKGKTTKPTPPAGIPETTATAETPKVETVPPLPVAHKLPDASFISSSKSQKYPPLLVDQIWHYSFALSIKDEVPKENLYKGQWLDLLPDGTFKQGLYDATTDSGYFTYNEKDGLLELRSDKASSEWKAKFDPTHMILIGTAKYGNNPWQMKLARRASLPKKEGSEKE